MRKKKLVWCSLLLLTLVAGTLIPDVRWAAIGLFKNESFFERRPTSYWSAELARWDDTCSFGAGNEPRLWLRTPTRWETWIQDYAGLKLTHEDNLPVRLGESSAALPVLIELLKDRNWKVRRVAVHSLGRLGPAAQPAYAPIKAALDASEPPLPQLRFADSFTEEGKFRQNAALALRAIDPHTAGVDSIPFPQLELAWTW